MTNQAFDLRGAARRFGSIDVGTPGAEHLINGLRQSVGYGHNGPLVPQAMLQTSIQVLHLRVVAPGGCPSTFQQCISQIRIAFGRTGTLALAATLVVARTDSCPGAQFRSRVKYSNVISLI